MKLFNESYFDTLVKYMKDALSPNINIYEKGKDSFVILEDGSNISEDKFTQINFRFENETLIIPWFYLKKPNQGIGSKMISWFISFCETNNIKNIEIRGVNQDKEGMIKLLNKFEFTLIRIKEDKYLDYNKKISV